MFDSILNTVKSQLGDQLIEKLGLNNEQASQTIDMAGESIQEAAEAEATSGNTDGLTHLFGSPDGHTSTTNPIVESMGNRFVSKMTSRLGVSDNVADLAKNLILPHLLKIISSKFSDSGETHITGLLSMLGGANNIDLGTMKDKVRQTTRSRLGGIL